MRLRHRHADDPPRIVTAGERRVGPLDAQMHILADEFQPRIAHENARQKTGLAEDLETVADAEHEAALGGILVCTASMIGARAAIAPQRK